jgi:DNA sulfur modification protein DndE
MSAPLVEVVRLGPMTKNRLMTLKRRTGIDNWNILCRWAFCLSLQEADPVGERHDETGVSIEMTWKTFAGDMSEIYEALLVSRAIKEAVKLEAMSAAALLRRHVTRGAARLVAAPESDAIAGLIRLGCKGSLQPNN